MLEIITDKLNIAQVIAFADNILQGRKEIPENIKGQSVLALIKKLNKGDFFDVCIISSLETITGIDVDPVKKEYFRSMHCVHYKDMTIETRQWLIASVVDIFRSQIIMSNANIGFNNSYMEQGDEEHIRATKAKQDME